MINPIRRFKNFVHLLQARKAARKYRFPERYLKTIGVTGTDGKTTTSSIIYHILAGSSLNAGYVSTTEAKIGDTMLDTGLHVTTPDPWVLPQYLRQMVDAEVEYVVLEATSIGLDQNRFGDLKFDAGVVTNIRNDHLDYHKTWVNYAKSKFRLLKKVKNSGVVVLNSDDDKSANWLRTNSHKLNQEVYVKWSSKNHVANYSANFTGIKFTYAGNQFRVPIFGADHNLENLIQAIMLTETMLPVPTIAAALESYHLPQGRMQVMIADPLRVIVDFAHTPNSLEQSLKAIRKILPQNKRIITVFGCAGKRDKGRRDMGKVSAELADITILTAEDPRSETVESINSEIHKRAKTKRADFVSRFKNHDDYALTSLGEVHAKLETAWKQNYKPVIAFDENSKNSRRDAIEMAIRLARRGDCVFITGKGHEKSLAFGKKEKEYSWSDQEEVTKALRRLKIQS